MARDSRLRRDMLVDIDTGALWKLPRRRVPRINSIAIHIRER